jgi:hypothetical protein
MHIGSKFRELNTNYFTTAHRKKLKARSEKSRVFKLVIRAEI